MPSPTLHTGCASLPRKTGRKPQHCAASRARKPPGRATAVRLSSSRLNWSECTRDGSQRLPLLRGLAERSLFFFDTKGSLNNLQFTGDDFFADKDVCSIALEVPNSVLGPGRVGPWARTLACADGGWIQ